jgi:hypothetical protein
VGDAGGVGGVDAVSAGEYFRAVAAFAEGEVRRVGDREAEEGVGVGGCGLGIQVGGRKKERR